MNPSTWRHFYKSLHKQSCILVLGSRIANFSGQSGPEQIDQAFSRQLSISYLSFWLLTPVLMSILVRKPPP